MFFRRKKARVPADESPRPPAAAPVTVEPPLQEEPLSRTVAPPAPGAAAGLPRRRISYRVANLQGLGRRERQEDAFAFINAMDVTEMRRNGLLAVVADGMGGMRDGKLASETVLGSLRADFPNLDRSGALPEQLCQCVRRAGERVFAALEGEGGSTVVACLFFDEALFYVSVGDSFLYLLRDGQLLRVNREHNLLHERFLETVRAGSMDPEPARADPEAAALSQFLGMPVLEEPDFLRRPLRLHHDDRFLICSDGVAGVLTEETLREALEAPAPEAACAALDAAVQARDEPFQDNYTALVVFCGY